MSLVERVLRRSFLRHREIADDLRNGKVHVSLLIRCRRYRELMARHDILFNPSPSMMLGEIVHEGVKSFSITEKLEGYEVMEERKINGKTIVGIADILYENEVVEIKFTRAHRDNRPLEHHLMQLRLYMWLFNRPRGRLVYVTPDRLCEYEIDNPMSDDEVIMLLEDESSPKWPEWECSYCDYSGLCEKRVRR